MRRDETVMGASCLVSRRAASSPCRRSTTRGASRRPREIQLVREWLDNWKGISHIATGMARRDYDLQLTRYDGRGWRATFDTSGIEHSATNATATAWERTPWRAVQVATWEALTKPGGHESPKPRHCRGHAADT